MRVSIAKSFSPNAVLKQIFRLTLGLLEACVSPGLKAKFSPKRNRAVESSKDAWIEDHDRSKSRGQSRLEGFSGWLDDIAGCFVSV